MTGETAAGRETQITIQCKRLETNIEDVRRSLATLEMRLESVLAPRRPETGRDEKALTQELVPHAAFLRQQADGVHCLAEGLSSLRDRIEL